MSASRLSEKANRLLSLLAAPIISLIAYVLAYWLDPLNFGSTQPMSALPAFFLSVVILLLGQAITVAQESHRSSAVSDKIYRAVRDYLHVTPAGSPEEAIRYIKARIPSLREVKNTSFSIDDELERVDEKLYETSRYTELCQDIAYYSCRGLLWKDVGDGFAAKRLRSIRSACDNISRGSRDGYRHKLIAHTEPQMNFIIMEYQDGTKEVLFNWDFRSAGQDPIVLISRDRQIVEMYAIHFTMLWRRASEDHDNQATSSVSTT